MKKLNYFIYILLLILLSSCVTKNDDFYFDSTPNWVNRDYENEVYNFYIIKGEGETQAKASYDAIFTFYNNLSKTVLIEDEQGFINNLNTNFIYEPLEMKIEKNYIETNNDNIYNITYLVSSKKNLIEIKEIEKKEVEKQNIDKLNTYENKSNDYYRNNKDLDSIKILINAYIFAKNNNYEKRAKVYLNTIISRISDINIKVYLKDSLNKLELKLYRDENYIDPIVLNAQLIASYNNINVRYENYLVEEVLLPYKEGLYDFDIKNRNLNEKGVIIFKLNLLDQLKLLKSNKFLDAEEQIDNAINEKIFVYDKESIFNNKVIYINIIENDENQNQLENISLKFIKTQLESYGATVIIKEDLNIDELDSLKNKGDYFFLFRAEIVEKKEGYKAIVLSHGSLEVYDLKDLNIFYDSTLIDSLYIGDSIEECEKESILRVAKKIFHSFMR